MQYLSLQENVHCLRKRLKQVCTTSVNLGNKVCTFFRQSYILLEKAIALVEKNLSNDQYTNEALSSDLCMSRMTLYRKIQAATGQKPTELMSTIRLRRAAELLREGQRTITEITYDTGFSSVSYFSRCFRAMYGVPPTQFQCGKGAGEA